MYSHLRITHSRENFCGKSTSKIGSLNYSHKFWNIQLENVFREKLVSWHWLQVSVLAGNYVACQLVLLVTRWLLNRFPWKLSTSTWVTVSDHPEALSGRHCHQLRPDPRGSSVWAGATHQPPPMEPEPYGKTTRPPLLHYRSDKLFFACSFYSQGILKMSEVLSTSYPT